MENETPNPEPSKKSARRNHGPRVPHALKVTAKVLHDQGMSERDIATELQLSRDSVQKALRNPEADREMVQKVAKTLQQSVSNKLTDLIVKLTEHMDNPEAIAKLGLYHSALTLAILVDKKRLIDGESTQNVAIRDVGAAIQEKLNEYAVLKAKLLEKLSQGSNS